jgi:hypothetical protein
MKSAATPHEWWDDKKAVEAVLARYDAVRQKVLFSHIRICENAIHEPHVASHLVADVPGAG